MQQVNLYQPLLRKQQKVFSTNTLLLGNLIILLGLLLLYGYSQLQTRTLQIQLDQATAQRNDRQQQLLQLQQQYPPRQADATLPEQLDATRNAIRQQQSLLRAVERYDGQPELRFSNQLRGLARQVDGPLWLSSIRLRPSHIHLMGQTREAEQVPRLVQALSNEAAFAGLSFEQVQISRDEESGLLHFSLNTRRDNDEGGR